jgi:chemotaxis protein methyltransferase CheR
MIYFDKPLQDRVLSLFYESLEMLGYLALGSKETLKFTNVQAKFRQVENKEKIWRKME